MHCIAQEQGWTHQETVEALVRKAGFRGQVDDQLLDRMSSRGYEASKCTLTFDQFQALTPALPLDN